MLSIVIPVYNEADSLEQLADEIVAVSDRHGYSLEVIFVDDGSTDPSWETIQRLATRDHRMQGIRLRRNFGKAAALSAGIEVARGQWIMTLDADLQDDPKEIPRFIAKLDENHDVVSGWKKIRRDPLHKTVPSRVFNWMVGRVTGVKLHDHNCGFKAYRREVFDEIHLYGELHRFVPVFAASRGWSVAEIEVDHRPRKHGRSKYGMGRFIKGFLDLWTVYFLTGFRQRPQHLLGTIGIAAFLVGLAGLTYLAGYWVVRVSFDMTDWPPVHQRPLALYALGALLVGAQFMSVGFLAELMTSYYGRQIVPYSIKQRVGGSTGTAASARDELPQTAEPSAYRQQPGVGGGTPVNEGPLSDT